MKTQAADMADLQAKLDKAHLDMGKMLMIQTMDQEIKNKLQNDLQTAERRAIMARIASVIGGSTIGWAAAEIILHGHHNGFLVASIIIASASITM
jgi:hypothetical protein